MSVQLDLFEQPTEPLDRLADYWHEANRQWFGGEMKPVPIVGGLENTKVTMGTWSPIHRRIEIRQSLLDRMDEPGMCQEITDVLLHEMIHQYRDQAQDYSLGVESAHGAEFTALCNRIGAGLGLAEVVARKPRGQKVPLSRHWPHCVRPDSKPLVRPKFDPVLASLWEIVRLGTPAKYSVEESMMADVLQVSRVTVHRKLCELERRGLMVRRDGRFYVVAAKRDD